MPVDVQKRRVNAVFLYKRSQKETWHCCSAARKQCLHLWRFSTKCFGKGRRHVSNKSATAREYKHGSLPLALWRSGTGAPLGLYTKQYNRRLLSTNLHAHCKKRKKKTELSLREGGYLLEENKVLTILESKLWAKRTSTWDNTMSTPKQLDHCQRQSFYRRINLCFQPTQPNPRYFELSLFKGFRD